MNTSFIFQYFEWNLSPHKKSQLSFDTKWFDERIPNWVKESALHQKTIGLPDTLEEYLLDAATWQT